MHLTLRNLLPVLAISWCLIDLTDAFYSKKDAVIEITPANFKEEVLDIDSIVLAEFYAPWCGHCKNMAPEYKKAAERLKGIVKVVAIDCDQHKDLCGRYQVKGFPTIKLFGVNKKLSPQDYQGERNSAAFVDYAIDKLPSNLVTKFNGIEKMNEFIEKNEEKPTVILVHSKSVIPPLYKALSLEFNNRAVFGQGKQENGDFEDKFRVDDLPILILTPAGMLKHDPLVEFIDKYALPKPKKETKKEKSKSTSNKPEETKEPFNPEIPELKSENDLKTQCADFNGICVITFVNLEPEYPESVSEFTESLSVIQSIKKKYWEKPSSSPTSVYKFVWVNAIERGKGLIKELDVSDILPSLVAVKISKGVYRLHRGAWDSENIERFLDEMAKGKGRNLTVEKGKTLVLDQQISHEELDESRGIVDGDEPANHRRLCSKPLTSFLRPTFTPSLSLSWLRVCLIVPFLCCLTLPRLRFFHLGFPPDDKLPSQHLSYSPLDQRYLKYPETDSSNFRPPFDELPPINSIKNSSQPNLYNNMDPFSMRQFMPLPNYAYPYPDPFNQFYQKTDSRPTTNPRYMPPPWPLAPPPHPHFQASYPMMPNYPEMAPARPALSDAAVQTDPVYISTTPFVPSACSTPKRENGVDAFLQANLGGRAVAAYIARDAGDSADDEDDEMENVVAAAANPLANEPALSLNQPRLPNEFVNSPKKAKKRKSSFATKAPIEIGDLRSGHWTDGETQRLLNAVESTNRDWDKIALVVGKRSKGQCEKRWRRVILRPDHKYTFPPSSVMAMDVAAQAAALTAPVKVEKEKTVVVKEKTRSKTKAAEVAADRKWDVKESMQLVLAVKRLGENNWETVANEICGGDVFTADQCLAKWKELEATYTTSEDDNSSDEDEEQTPKKIKLADEIVRPMPKLIIRVKEQKPTIEVSGIISSDKMDVMTNLNSEDDEESTFSSLTDEEILRKKMDMDPKHGEPEVPKEKDSQSSPAVISSTPLSDSLSRVLATTLLKPPPKAAIPDNSITSTSTSTTPSPAALVAAASAAAPPTKQRIIPWSKIDNDNLIAGVKKYGNIWAKVSEEVPGRTDRQCKDHWNRVLARREDCAGIIVVDIANEYKRLSRPPPSTPPSSVKPRPQVMGAWNADEDNLLLEGHAQHGPKWILVAQSIPGRDSKQCQKRFKRIVDSRKLKVLQKEIEASLASDASEGKATVDRLGGVILTSRENCSEKKIEEFVGDVAENINVVATFAEGKECVEDIVLTEKNLVV
ncbi:protein disulfide isomerase (PDI) protein [Nowakowskiella sp. JEL0078]|nr:protein disulfide isomerase (PDI) protein [Nowakowskiella sp. JEL0078]